MTLVDQLSPEAVCLDLKSTRRDDALRALLTAMTGCGVLDPEVMEEAFQSLVRREMLGSTGIGNGVAVPHARMDALEGLCVGVGLSRDGIEFHSLDGGPVHLVFLVLGPKENADDYLAAMQSVTKLVHNGDFRRFAMQAKSQQEVVELVEEMDG